MKEGMGTNKIICDVCGREKKPHDNIMIEGKLRICSRKVFDKGNTVLISCDNRDVFLCERCSERIMKCITAMKEHKRIRIGRKDE